MLILSDYFVSAIFKDMYSVRVRRNRMDSSNGVFLLNSFMLNKLKISVESLDQVNEIAFRTKQLNEIVSYCLFLFSVISIKTHYRPAAVLENCSPFYQNSFNFQNISNYKRWFSLQDFRQENEGK